MSVIARWCFQHRLAVLAAWVLALIALTALAQAVKAEYSDSFSLPGTGSTIAQQLLASTVPAQSGDSDTIVWHVGTGTVGDPAVMTRMSAALARIGTLPEVASVTSPYGPGGTAQISRDDRTAYAVVHFTKQSFDLATADGVLAIIEVRQRESADFGGALASVTWSKRRKIILATQHFLQREKLLYDRRCFQFRCCLFEHFGRTCHACRRQGEELRCLRRHDFAEDRRRRRKSKRDARLGKRSG